MSPHSIPSEHTSTSNSDRASIHVGLYVDDFVFYSTDPAEEELFRSLFSSKITVDFMGDVDYFLDWFFFWVVRFP